MFHVVGRNNPCLPTEEQSDILRKSCKQNLTDTSACAEENEEKRPRIYKQALISSATGGEGRIEKESTSVGE